MCYTYDSLGRVTKRTTKNLSDVTLYEENYSYDAAGNIVGDTANVGFTYDTNNRLVMFNGRSISYDLDGNMTDDYCAAYSYDSANRLLHVDGHMYTYNAEDVRIRNHSAEYDTTYTYDTNRKLSRLLEKTTNNVATKYVYGHGLICEETSSTVKTYHFDNRGSTVAITDASGNITDTITYDTYGMQTSHIGTSDVIFAYNGRDGVITDDNDLIYMRARYYSPVMRRFINADIIHGTISDSTSLNRYSYVNGNPVSFVDPFGLERELANTQKAVIDNILKKYAEYYNQADKMNAAFVEILSYLSDAISMNASVSEDTMINLGEAGEIELYFKLESSVGNGENSIDVNKLIEQLSSEDVIDFLNNSGVFNFDVFKKNSGNLQINDYASLSTSSNVLVNGAKGFMYMKSSVSLVLDYGEAGTATVTFSVKNTKPFYGGMRTKELSPEYAHDYEFVGGSNEPPRSKKLRNIQSPLERVTILQEISHQNRFIMLTRYILRFAKLEECHLV